MRRVWGVGVGVGGRGEEERKRERAYAMVGWNLYSTPNPGAAPWEG